MPAQVNSPLFRLGPRPVAGAVVHENFIEISPNIFSSFDIARPPVALYCLSAVWDIPMLLCRAREPMMRAEQVEMARLSEQRMLFLSRRDYSLFSLYLSKRLGLLLLEDRLDPGDAAHVFFLALADSLLAFYRRPLPRTLDKLRDDIAILCEYLWTDRARVRGLVRCLECRHSLIHHSIKVCFIGLALYSRLYGEDKAKDDMTGTALGLILHDLGALRMPEYTWRSFKPLTAPEVKNYRRHPELGLDTLRRFRDLPPEVPECVTDHHERLDGSGWPRGLSRPDMGTAARLCALADTFCELIEDRGAMPGLSPEHAAAGLLLRGHLFDTSMVWELYNYVLATVRRVGSRTLAHCADRASMAGGLSGRDMEFESIEISGADPCLLGAGLGSRHREVLPPTVLEAAGVSAILDSLSESAPAIRRVASKDGSGAGRIPSGGTTRATGRIPLTDILSGGVDSDISPSPESTPGAVQSTDVSQSGMSLEQDRVEDTGASTRVGETRVNAPVRGLEETDVAESGGSTPVESFRPQGGGARLVLDETRGQGAHMQSGNPAENSVRYRAEPDSPDTGNLKRQADGGDSAPGEAVRIWTRTRDGYTLADDIEDA